MTRAFTEVQKYRILVAYSAQIIVDGTLVHVAAYAYGTESPTRRFKMLRRDVNCAVRCACGCETWAPLREIDFDHETPWIQTRRSIIAEGRPLRRAPCHRAKSASEQKVTGKITRLRNKLSVTTEFRDDDLPPAKSSRWSWPTRPLTDPKWKRGVDGRTERRAP